MAIKTLNLSGNQDKKVFALIAGKAGIGKTTLVTQFPKEDVLFVSVERGELSIQGSGIVAVSVDTQTDVMELIKQIPDVPFRYIFIDSLSEIYDQINTIARSSFTAKQNFAKHDEIKFWLIHMIKALRDIPNKDIFLTCHVKDEKNGPVIEQELCFDGKLPTEIKKQFDVIIHMDKKKDSSGKEERVFITSPELSNIGKTRVSPFLGIKIENVEKPDLYKLTKKFKGEKNAN